MVLDAPSNQGAHQGKRAAETQAQQYDEQPEGLEPRMAGIDSVRRPSPSIQVRCSTTKVEVTIDIGTLNLPCHGFVFTHKDFHQSSSAAEVGGHW
jgi:hypothetical protein